VRQSPLLLSESARSSALHQSGTFILVGSGDSMTVHPVPDVVSALPRSDLLLLSCHVPPGTVNTLPVSPYPAHEDASILAHFVSHKRPSESGWHPWVGDTWGKWVKGKVLGYRDFAGREAKVSLQSKIMQGRFLLQCTAWNVRCAFSFAFHSTSDSRVKWRTNHRRRERRCCWHDVGHENGQPG